MPKAPELASSAFGTMISSTAEDAPLTNLCGPWCFEHVRMCVGVCICVGITVLSGLVASIFPALLNRFPHPLSILLAVVLV